LRTPLILLLTFTQGDTLSNYFSGLQPEFIYATQGVKNPERV
jgi:hypothetical protein